MLTLEFEKEGFKRYNNGKGYLICVDKSGSSTFHRIFIDDKHKEKEKYLPNIMADYCLAHSPLDDNYFRVDHCMQLEPSPIAVMVAELEKHLAAYKVAQESIEEFQKAILNGEI